MLICENCGRLADEDDLEIINDRDYVNNGVGLECVRKDSWFKECSCGGNWEKAKKCKLCEEWFYDEDYAEICNKCLEENATFENALMFGDNFKTDIQINGYLAEEYSQDKIENLILKDLKETKLAGYKLNYVDYCLFDKYDFADWLKKQKLKELKNE